MVRIIRSTISRDILDARIPLTLLSDYKLGSLLSELGDSYTVILFSDPNEYQAYEPEFVEPVHMDLKRQSDNSLHLYGRSVNSTDDLPLFEKYQFFTPGIFMGFIALFVILSILEGWPEGYRELGSLIWRLRQGNGTGHAEETALR